MDELLDPKVVVGIGSALATALGIYVKGYVRRGLAESKNEGTLTEKLIADTSEIRRELWLRVTTLEANFQRERESFAVREQGLREEMTVLVRDNSQLKMTLAGMERRVKQLEALLKEHNLPTNGS